MATPTYTLIDSTVLGSSASSVTFSGISATGKGDLVLVMEYLANTSTADANVQLNSDTLQNYPYVVMTGTGSSAVSGQSTTYPALRTGFDSIADTTSKHNVIMQILDYSATDKHKSVLVRSGGAGTYDAAEAWAERWASTSAVTQIDIKTFTDAFAAGSSFYLFQIVSE